MVPHRVHLIQKLKSYVKHGLNIKIIHTQIIQKTHKKHLQHTRINPEALYRYMYQNGRKHTPKEQTNMLRYDLGMFFDAFE